MGATMLTDLNFLSCLSGSDALYCRRCHQYHFLSCLSGSDAHLLDVVKGDVVSELPVRQ